MWLGEWVTEWVLSECVCVSDVRPFLRLTSLAPRWRGGSNVLVYWALVKMTFRSDWGVNGFEKGSLEPDRAAKIETIYCSSFYQCTNSPFQWQSPSTHSICEPLFFRYQCTTLFYQWPLTILPMYPLTFYQCTTHYSTNVHQWVSEWVVSDWVNEWLGEWVSEWVSECVCVWVMWDHFWDWHF